jgi:hypothetical protein
MKRFSVGQRWVNEDATWGRFLAEVIDIADEERRGTVVITDGHGNVLDTFSGTAAAFQTSDEWQLIEPVCMIGLYSRLVKARLSGNSRRSGGELPRLL